jgi:1,3-beta-galactosyl-N-acetylhexosamine phosphorylase
MKRKGRFTLPGESNFLDEIKEIMEKWGADAIRDSDGTKLDDEIKKLDTKIYTTYFVARAHNKFAEKHMEECQQLYLMSKFNMAEKNELYIDFLEGYFEEQIKPDYVHDEKVYWEVIDRTSDEIVPVSEWELDKEKNRVHVKNAKPFHEYTVSFLAYMIWDPTQMYNHITNNWGDKPHDIPFDVRQPASNVFMSDYLKKWLKENPDTDVVRFTTFFYHFTLVFNNLGKEKFVEWFGYGASVSVAALEAFAESRGYRLRAEDIIDKGYYNTAFRVPTEQYLDYIDFIQEFVAKEAKKLVDIVHKDGKEAMMFLGDNWIGTEPYGKYFEQIGLDAVAGSVGGGATLRMIADIPHVKYTEGRFLPYFFPDTFYEGNDPLPETVQNWITARRAILRNPVDRIGYGGYLSLAYKFPKFVDCVEKIADEFREIYDIVKGGNPYCKMKVAILNSWGKLRTWQTHMVAHALHYKQIYSYLGVLESLSGMAVDVSFISFDDVIHSDILDKFDVVINAGDAGTAFSGGEIWRNETLVAKIREWVYNGGGFIGIGEPSAYEHGGRFFQLAQVLGVDKELGFSLSTDKYFTKEKGKHFITEDVRKNSENGKDIFFGESMKNIYALYENTEILEFSNGEIHLSSHDFGKGRGIYIAGLPYSDENTRLLWRALHYAAHKENEFNKWNCTNVHCEVHIYPEKNKIAYINNSTEEQVTEVYDERGASKTIKLNPGEIIWEELQ